MPTGRYRRALLGALGLAAFAGPATGSGCAAGFAPSSALQGLRVLAVETDKPYAQPGDTLTLEMVYTDTKGDPADVQIVWLGGCYNPAGDTYYGCYSQFASALSDLDPTSPGVAGLLGFGKTFTFTLPEDLLTSRKSAAGAPSYGLAYVFFAACAGTLGPAPAESSGAAGSFPLGCFSKDGERLGAERFVPGFTQVYAFADGRSNNNPVVEDLTLDGVPISETEPPEVKLCPAPVATRLGPTACSESDAFSTCTSYELSVVVPDDVAEVDPEGKQPDGSPVYEAVWVDYFADKGDIQTSVTLVSDATTGIRDEYQTKWIAPPEAGPVEVWAVVHDARGGQTAIKRTLQVK